jgi:hypothetical protein
MRRNIKIDPDLNVGAVLERAEKIAARANKRGLLGGYKVEIINLQSNWDGVPFEQPTLVIDGEPAAYSGWKFVALVEWIDDSAVTTGSPFANDLAPVDRSTLVKGACDHCGWSRARKYAVVVENEDGERKQIGKSCVKDFLGHSLSLSWFADPFDEFEGYHGRGTGLLNTRETLAIAYSVIRQRGFVSKAKALEENRTPTAELVQLTMDGKPRNERDRVLYEELWAGWDAHVDRFNAVRIHEFADELDSSSDWAANVKAVVAQTHFNPKHLALVVSLAGVYVQKTNRDAQDVNAVDEEFGQIGERVTVDLTVQSSTAFDSHYGITFANTFLSEDGHRFKWLTGTRSFDEGETVTLTGTIKKYDEWNDKVFTVLTRCKEAVA